MAEEMIRVGRLTMTKQQRLNMERCAEFVARMVQKYGDEVLRELEAAEKNECVEK